MFNSNVLDVAVGLVFIFLLLSLICSAANEILEGFLKQRAGNLERGIQEMVGQGNEGFVAKLYNHGLINSLYRGEYKPAPWWQFWRKANLPSYIPSRNFALALLDLARSGEKLPPNVADAFGAFEKSAGNNAAMLQHNVEDWFNSSMDRVSGWYKRYSQRLVLVMGLAAAVLVNADCIQIAKRLMTDASLRNSVSTLADSATTKPDPTSSALDRIKGDLQTLDNIGLPLGWYRSDHQKIHFGQEISAHWLGWLLTALAVSLGAPFWFDVLNKIIVVRSTVKPAEKSGPEASKDASSSSAPLAVVAPATAPVVAAPAPPADPNTGNAPPAADDGAVVAGG